MNIPKNIQDKELFAATRLPVFHASTLWIPEFFAPEDIQRIIGATERS